MNKLEKKRLIFGKRKTNNGFKKKSSAKFVQVDYSIIGQDSNAPDSLRFETDETQYMNVDFQEDEVANAIDVQCQYDPDSFECVKLSTDDMNVYLQEVQVVCIESQHHPDNIRFDGQEIQKSIIDVEICGRDYHYYDQPDIFTFREEYEKESDSPDRLMELDDNNSEEDISETLKYELHKDNLALQEDNDVKINGRRIINIKQFVSSVQEMNNHAFPGKCNFSDMVIEKEIRNGFNSKIIFRCKMCNIRKEVSTNEINSDLVSVNKSAILGITSIGGGYFNLEELCAILDIPCMSNFKYTSYQNDLRNDLQNAASRSMNEAMSEEAKIAVELGVVDTNGVPMITVVTDGAWSKRSYRNNYSALSGVVSIIGFYTKKVLWMGVKNKFCMTCQRYANRKINSSEHDCNKNFNGPSTGMEAALVVEGFLYLEKNCGLSICRFIGDGDSSVHKSLIEHFPTKNIQKVECRNHLIRNFTTKLLNIVKETRFPIRYRKVLAGEIRRITVAIRCAIKYRKNENLSLNLMTHNLKKDLTNIPNHIFGDHTKCDSYFCNPDKKITPNIIPAMKESKILGEIMNHMKRLHYNADSLILDIDSNIVEQFNAIVAKMVGGKRINYSSGKSYSDRCLAAVVQHNTGQLFSKVFEDKIGKNFTYEALKVESKRIKIRLRQKLKINHVVRQKKVHATCDSNYGADTCSVPDLTSDLIEIEKQNILRELQENCHNRDLIEKQTKEQSNSNDWMKIRRMMLTSSNFGKICKRKSKFANLVKQIFKTNSMNPTLAMKHGLCYEETARIKLSNELGKEIQKCGLTIDKDILFLASSPDGLLGEDALIEIKCPYTSYGLNVDEQIRTRKITCYSYDKKTKIIKINKKHDYYYQIQGQLNILERDFCLLVHFTGEDQELKITKVDREMVPRLKNFFFDHYIFELVDPRIPRGLEPR